MQTFHQYETTINNHYKNSVKSIVNNKGISSNNMSTYIDYLTGDSGTQTKFQAPPSKFINMSKAPSNENIPLVVCKNDSGGRDNKGRKIVTKPFTWFVNNNNQFDTTDNNRNNNLLDNIIKNDSDLHKDTYLNNILNQFDDCVYRGMPTIKDSNKKLKNTRKLIKNLRDKYRNEELTKESLDLQINTIRKNMPWIRNEEDNHLQKLGKYKFKDGFSNYQVTKKHIGLSYFASLSIILLIIIYRLK